jgi:dTDP-3-amino-3,4,6-trideoxy-alpha-D-glucose transaminase
LAVPPPELAATQAVPLALLDHADSELFDELLAAVGRVAAAGAFTGGAEVEGFEREFALYCDARHAVGVSSGTEALAIILRALGIGAGDEVIVPANSFIATAEAVSLVGATPRPIDVDPESRTIVPAAVEAAITPRTRCLIAVHLHGRTAEMEPLVAFARECGLRVVEDACQAHGARYRGRPVGAIGDAGAFSFYPAKNLGAWGDAGAVVTDDPETAEHARLLRAHGERPRYHHKLVGTTARLDALQAAVLRIKLARLEDWNDRRRRNADRLRALLAAAPIGLPAPPADGQDHVHHHFVVTSERRDALREHLAAREVASAIHYPIPIHLTDAYADLGLEAGELPVAERLAKTSCSLPIGPLQTDDELVRIAAAVGEFGEGC